MLPNTSTVRRFCIFRHIGLGSCMHNKLTHPFPFYSLTRQLQGVYRVGRWRSLRRTSPREGLSPKPLQRRQATTPLGQSCLGSSSLLSSAHLYSRSFGQQQAAAWHE